MPIIQYIDIQILNKFLYINYITTFRQTTSYNSKYYADLPCGFQVATGRAAQKNLIKNLRSYLTTYIFVAK